MNVIKLMPDYALVEWREFETVKKLNSIYYNERSIRNPLENTGRILMAGSNFKKHYVNKIAHYTTGQMVKVKHNGIDCVIIPIKDIFGIFFDE